MSEFHISHAFLTVHGEIRIRGRLKSPKKSADKQAFEAIEKGLPRDESRGELRRYADRKYFEHDKECQLYFWRGFLCVFGGNNRLITCYPIPGNFNRDVVIQSKKWRKKITTSTC